MLCSVEEVNRLSPWESGKDKLEFLCAEWKKKRDIQGRPKDVSKAGRYERR